MPFKLQFVSGVCIGVGKTTDVPGYVEMICNTILPETDEEYAKEKKKIIGYMKTIAEALNKKYK